jgi:hypothetical protein
MDPAQIRRFERDVEVALSDAGFVGELVGPTVVEGFDFRAHVELDGLRLVFERDRLFFESLGLLIDDQYVELGDALSFADVGREGERVLDEPMDDPPKWKRALDRLQARYVTIRDEILKGKGPAIVAHSRRLQAQRNPYRLATPEEEAEFERLLADAKPKGSTLGGKIPFLARLIAVVTGRAGK